ncbi:PREDICTED: mitotic spindle checkpoint protein MAD1-like [Camelina sativa]|uniref:Mitotic spindle checkpoint protein MAD1-like n=1 Tax=Camelina sativa TaxID=90675 RepID=A0ABM1QZC1_CAMSA|nr:PREDICTED: mitotic spindle checkpoint protein MAD1-like [Camelina sativa]
MMNRVFGKPKQESNLNEVVLRTPPPKRLKSDAGGSPISANASGSGKQIVIYEDSPLPAPALLQTLSDHSDQHLCTYQCRILSSGVILYNK